MKKIPTLFVRDPDDPRHLLHDVAPGCEWVFVGEGVPTRKYDGVCTLLNADGEWFARREVKADKSPPDGFIFVDGDPTTGKSVGWVPIEQSGHAKWHTAALETRAARGLGPLTPGTYELCGPKVNGNPEDYGDHILVAHETAQVVELHWDPLRDDIDVQDEDYGGLRPLLLHLGELGHEGIVWHHPDGRMAKLKARDFR